MTYEFKRRRVAAIFLALLATAIVGGFLAVDAFAIPNSLWPLKLLLAIPALALAALLPGIYLDVFAPGPILTISAEGIRYLPFSRETVPWSAIQNVSFNRGYSHTRASSDYYRFKLMDTISFAVTDPKRFPVPPLGLRANSVPVSIMRASVQASPEEIANAVRACWSGGVQVADSVPPESTLHQDND